MLFLSRRFGNEGLTMRTVLITGIDGSAAQSILKCLRMSGNYRIIVTGIDPLCVGLYRGDIGYLMPTAWSEFKVKLAEICKTEDVEIIIPGSDIELEQFVKDKLWYEQNCPPMIIDWKNAEVARDKYLTSQTLSKLGFKTPKTWLYKDFDKIDVTPVIIKPRRGFGSKFLFKQVRSSEAKFFGDFLLGNGWEPVAQETLIGNEYSAMTLCAKDGELLCSFTAWSEKKFGQSYRTIIKKGDPTIDELIKEISMSLSSVGPLSIQMILDVKSGEYKIFELNARFTGAQIIRAMAGQNMPDLIVRNWLDGIKEFPKVKGTQVALWYQDFSYVPVDTTLDLYTTGKCERKKGKFPHYL